MFFECDVQGWCVLPTKSYDVKGKPDWEPRIVFCYPHYINIYFSLQIKVGTKLLKNEKL